MKKYKTNEYQALADCIRSGQVPADHISKIMNEDSGFAVWYYKKYIKKEN